jgi:cytochrome c-type biogenesis protein CcmE
VARRGVRQGRWLLVGCLVVDALVVWFAFTREPRVVYARTVEEALGAQQEPGESPERIRVSGVLVQGSVQVLERCRAEFRLRSLAPSQRDANVAHGNGELTVVYAACEAPGGGSRQHARGIFCDVPGLEQPLHVEGYLTKRGTDVVLVASRVLATCPSKYSASGKLEALGRFCETAPEPLRSRCEWCAASDY